MKDNIKTAWAYFTKNASDQFIDSLSREQLLIITKAMQEYAEQFIDLAAEEATATSLIEDELSGEEVESDFGWAEVDKESILKVKQLIK